MPSISRGLIETIFLKFLKASFTKLEMRSLVPNGTFLTLIGKKDLHDLLEYSYNMFH